MMHDIPSRGKESFPHESGMDLGVHSAVAVHKHSVPFPPSLEDLDPLSARRPPMPLPI